MAMFQKIIALGGLFLSGGGVSSLAHADTLTLDPALCAGTWEIVSGTLRCNTGGGGGGGETPGFFTISNTIVVSEGGTATATIARTNGSQGIVSVEVSASQNTALAGIDFTLPTQNPTVLTWGNADTSTRSFSVQTINDTDTESTETFFINLANATGGAQIQTSTSTVSITDNDGGGGGGGGGGSCGTSGKLFNVPNIGAYKQEVPATRGSEFAFQVDSNGVTQGVNFSFTAHRGEAVMRLVTLSESPCDFNIANKVNRNTYAQLTEGSLALIPGKNMIAGKTYYFNLRTTNGGIETCPVGKACDFIINVLRR